MAGDVLNSSPTSRVTSSPLYRVDVEPGLAGVTDELRIGQSLRECGAAGVAGGIAQTAFSRVGAPSLSYLRASNSTPSRPGVWLMTCVPWKLTIVSPVGPPAR